MRAGDKIRDATCDFQGSIRPARLGLWRVNAVVKVAEEMWRDLHALKNTKASPDSLPKVNVSGRISHSISQASGGPT
jgi:hypothetical protein